MNWPDDRSAVNVGNFSTTPLRGALTRDNPDRGASGLQMRAARAAADIMEALSLTPPVQLPGSPSGAPGQPPGGSPTVPAPQGALNASQGPAMPQQRPAMSPLQMMPSMHAPPMEAVLQGSQGVQGAQRPVGFARGGLAVFRGN